MDKETRGAIEKATQRARALLEAEFAEQLEGTFDVLLSGVVAKEPGPHLGARERLVRERIVAAIDHKRAAGMTPAEAVADFRRDLAFTTLNRFAALKMLEARGLLQECVTRGELSSGYKEMCGLAPGLGLLPEGAGYRLYLESLFDELSTEVKVLFDRRDAASALWPRWQALARLQELLNEPAVVGVWAKDETIGWIYQYFNSKDERQSMRDSKQGGSRAPRNSRELAVRNQFFTPLYVVRFLVDNTLGRLWLEMYGEATTLQQRCQYLARSAEHPLDSRSRKDPRDLNILDPACGSGHFLLYCFDLLLPIYEEAWHHGTWPASHLTGKTLREDYPDLDVLRRAVPALIVEHNLHGVDIDPRCTQIAVLALWLRAQRAWMEAGIPADKRPRIQKTQIVLAEPIPGDGILVDEFAARLDPPLLGELFRKLVTASGLAGELGPLLQVERAIASELTRAREQFVRRQVPRYLSGLEPTRREGELDLAGIDDARFFNEAEARIVAALQSFAEVAEASGGARRRLFAGDALHGIALVSLGQTRFDLVLMNPPFGECTPSTREYIDERYRRSKGNLLANFLERGAELLLPNGLLGAIVSRTCFYLKTFSGFRQSVLEEDLALLCCADLGLGVLDAMVETAATVFTRGCLEAAPPATFFREVAVDEKQSALLADVDSLRRGTPSTAVFRRSPTQFKLLVDAPYVYWITPEIARRLGKGRTVEPAACELSVGLQTGDDFRFLRLWSEVPSDLIVSGTGADERVVPAACVAQTRSGKAWAWYSKIDAAALFVAPIHLVVNWRANGSEVKAFHERNGHAASKYVMSESLYFRPGLSYMLRSSRVVPYIVPRGVIPTAGRSQAYPAQGLETWLLVLLASNVGSAVARFRGENFGQPKFQNSMVGAIPYVDPPPEWSSAIGDEIGVRVYRQLRELASDEASVNFVLPAGPGLASDDGVSGARDFDRHSLLGAEADRWVAAAFGLSEGEQKILELDLHESIGAGATCEANAEDDEDDAPGKASVPTTGEADLLSWATGVAFGRFDVRLVAGASSGLPKSHPFDPLPACSPGMLVSEEGLPLPGAPSGYPLAFPLDGILVDDPGHPRDLTAALRAVFDSVFGYSADARWNTTAAGVDPHGHDIRAWLASAFFDYHLRRYSRSRRKAPIYWQLATPSGRYSVWLYAHRVTRDTLFKVQNDVVAAKLAHEERQLVKLIAAAGPSPSASMRKELAAQEMFVEELRAQLDEVRRVAPLWYPDLSDGVVLVLAPLWRLCPHGGPWQKELRSRWDDLVAGKYDWAHIAMHLWPERVVPRCVTDRSLAIAHGLQDAFWREDATGKWQPRETPTRPVADLVHERTSPAVKAALASLLIAPVQGSGRKRSRRGA